MLLSVNPEHYFTARYMKKIVSILFLLTMCGTLLPAVLFYETKKVPLFIAVANEQPSYAKQVTEKEDGNVLLHEIIQPLTRTHRYAGYPNLFILFANDPCMGNPNPPADWFC
jgi:hypothetical protein